MRRLILLTLLFWTAACQPLEQPTPTRMVVPSALPSVAPTATQPYVYLTPTPGYPEQGIGPAAFPVDINPLTGLSVDPVYLNRRPVIVKVSNLPRAVRPQFGLSLADLVYEYYTEEGTTRFAAIFYSKDAEKVGSIRSARFFDEHLVHMYQGIFVFGSGDDRVRERLYKAEFADRLIVEWQVECPAMCRPDPVTDILVADTSAIHAYAAEAGISDERPELDGMFFNPQVPGGGRVVPRVFVWYSRAIYNRWDYEAGRYFRYSDADNAFVGQPETYKQLTDALTKEPIAADNLVVLLMPHTFFSVSPEMVEMDFFGSGPAYVFRDGQAFEVEWVREKYDLPVQLVLDGAPFPLKPGVTWFEVMGVSTTMEQQERYWRYEMRFP